MQLFQIFTSCSSAIKRLAGVEEAVGVAEATPEVIDERKGMVKNRDLLLTNRLDRDFMRDARMAVAVAADPGAELKERGNLPGLLGIGLRERGFIVRYTRGTTAIRLFSTSSNPWRTSSRTVGRLERMVSESQIASTSSATSRRRSSRTCGSRRPNSRASRPAVIA